MIPPPPQAECLRAAVSEEDRVIVARARYIFGDESKVCSEEGHSNPAGDGVIWEALSLQEVQSLHESCAGTNFRLHRPHVGHLSLRSRRVRSPVT